ncbi:MAG: DUF484 family protein [Burkholderiales bacterium]|nr:MAG: DUF484 family protein [Burkholderiales bacterium]
MTETIPLDAERVAQYLREHPDFLDAHPDLLAVLTVPHAPGGRAVSLVERQVEVLREKCKQLELRLAELIRNAQENDAIATRLQSFTRDLLVARDPAQLPILVETAMRDTFSVPQVALRLWSVSADFSELPCVHAVEASVRTLASSLKRPFCGPNSDLRPAVWLQDGGASARSAALISLRVGARPDAFGLLVLGSADPERFAASMGTAFLERIGEVASAALSRLTE